MLRCDRISVLNFAYAFVRLLSSAGNRNQFFFMIFFTSELSRDKYEMRLPHYNVSRVKMLNTKRKEIVYTLFFLLMK